MMNELIAEEKIGKSRLRLLKGDITLAQTEAIVNAANSHLQHGGGVAAAIVRRGGNIIQEESDKIGFVPEGEWLKLRRETWRHGMSFTPLALRGVILRGMKNCKRQ